MGTKSSLPRRVMSAAWMQSVCLGLLLGGVSGCNGNDPVPQAIIDDLPAEDPGGPSATHRAGQPCLQCHSTYGEALPQLVIGGTVFKEDPMTGNLLPAPHVRVEVYDSAGDFRVACSNAAGNFSIEKSNWEKITFPLKSFVGNDHTGNATRRMRSIIGREGSCANCHKLSGPAHDSPGVIIVDEGEEDQGTETCATVP
jgi:hypothetical protein